MLKNILKRRFSGSTKAMSRTNVFYAGAFAALAATSSIMIKLDADS
jgi:hypothetical protein